MQARIAVVSGDGIGPEVTTEALQLLDVIATEFQHEFSYSHGLIGGIAYDETGNPLPEETISICRKADAVLLGAVGGPKWDALPGTVRPEAGLLGLRKVLSVYANVRPIQVWPDLIDASPLRPEVLAGADFVILRELTGGLYFGEPRLRRESAGGVEAVDTLVYSEVEIERIVRMAFDMARGRRQHVTSVDKANVLESSRLWRETTNRVHQDYPDVTLDHMLVDTAAMQLISNPRQFDVMVTENMFGDILSDEAATLTGSIGLLPSASLSAGGPGLYEPIHGSAPDIAGQGLANPLAMMLSVAMMLRHSFGLTKEADDVEAAVQEVIASGARTRDLARNGEKVVSTTEMGDLVRHAVRRTVHAKDTV